MQTSPNAVCVYFIFLFVFYYTYIYFYLFICRLNIAFLFFFISPIYTAFWSRNNFNTYKNVIHMLCEWMLMTLYTLSDYIRCDLNFVTILINLYRLKWKIWVERCEKELFLHLCEWNVEQALFSHLWVGKICL